MSRARIVHLMRHGEPEGAGRMIGHGDPPATPAGIAACRAAAARLSPPTTIVASDLARARACAEAIGMSVTYDPRWRELDFGAWDGLHPRDIDAGALGRFWDDPDAEPPPGGERWSALLARVGAAIATIEDRTLVVTHAGAIRAALSVLCGFDARQVWAFDLPYAAVVTLRLWPDGAQITGLST